MDDAHNNFFKLMVHGQSLDVDAVLARSLFSFDHVWRRGGFRKTDGEIIPRTSGVEKHLEDGRVIDVLAQEALACDFFEGHRDRFAHWRTSRARTSGSSAFTIRCTSDPERPGWASSPARG